MKRVLFKIKSRRISSQFLVMVVGLLLIPLMVMLYDLYFASKTEEAMLKDQEKNLKSSVESVIIPDLKEYLEQKEPFEIDEAPDYLKNYFNESFSFLVASNPGVRFGLYFPDSGQIVVKGFLHQYREMTPEEQQKRKERVLNEARSGLKAVAASGEPLSKLTTSLKDETYEYLSPLFYEGEMVAVVWTDKRLHPVFAQSRSFLSFLKYVALIGLFMGGIGSMTIIHNMTGSVKRIKEGLQNMQYDINSRMPSMNGEFGEIAEDINKMANAVAEKERLEEELHRAARLAALGRLVAGVAHELRNPIGIVKTTTQLLEQELQSRNVKDLTEYSSIIKEQVERQNRVIEELLAYGKPGKTYKGYVAVNSLVNKVLTFTSAMLRQHDINLNLQLKEDLPVVWADGEQIKRIYVNLILNAVQAMPEGGELKITTYKEDNFICTSFYDTGGGIPPEELKNIFDPFYTTRDSGTGLGLSICYQLVSLNDGHIDVDNTGAGACFTVKLPLPGESRGDTDGADYFDY